MVPKCNSLLEYVMLLSLTLPQNLNFLWLSWNIVIILEATNCLEGWLIGIGGGLFWTVCCLKNDYNDEGEIRIEYSKSSRIFKSL